METPVHYLKSELQRIAEFLYRPENIGHQDVRYMNFSADTGVFEDQATGSHIYLEFSEADRTTVTQAFFRIEGDGGIIREWIRIFEEEFGASVEWYQ
jgi:hypothetical protein